MDLLNVNSFKDAWDVFLLFAIPVGGGIPAGVVMAQAKGIDWLSMTLLYFVSDVALALTFEPIMKFFAFLGRRFSPVAKVIEAMRRSTDRTVARYGTQPGPILLISIAFGIDPMTGRAAALAAGHNFLTGWAIAITGDMFFFALIAVSTISLNNILGDGTWAAVIIMAAMMIIPPVIRKIRASYRLTNDRGR